MGDKKKINKAGKLTAYEPHMMTGLETERLGTKQAKKDLYLISGKTAAKEAKADQKRQEAAINKQKAVEKARLAEAESDVKRRRFKMSSAAQYGRSSLLGG